MSTEVKDKRLAQGEATRAALVAAARDLFGEEGYAAASTEDIVARAGVTKGALYHHFSGKEDVFRAVLEQVQQEVSDRAVAKFLLPDSWQALIEGCNLWIDAHLDPSVRRIVLRDARAVLSWDDVRSIENRFGVVAVRGALRKAVHAGVIERQPLRPLALLLIGALSEACQYVADADDPVAARAEVGELIERLLSSFRVPAAAPAGAEAAPAHARQGDTLMGHHEPVSDWATDFDHTDDVWAADPYAIWDDLREKCPMAHTTRYGGAWLPTRFEDVAAIAYDTERFTSRSIVMSEFRPPEFLAPAGIAPPISSDPPYHNGARRMLLPIFSPQAVDKLEPSTRAYCEELIEAMRGQDVVDAAADYAQHIPVRVIANMLGLPESDADVFRNFVNHVLEGVALPMEKRAEGMLALFGYLQGHIDDHVANPRDDLISFLLQSELEGVPLDPFQVARTIGLLLIAGIDTTWSAIGASIWHLAKTPADRERLVAEPALLPVAIEELLRAYAPVTMARLVREDMDYNGCPMRHDEWVLLPFPAANRDPAAFDRADEVIIDREENRHAAFGLGIHRCAGSHLARMEMRVALETWLEAFPNFGLEDPDAVSWSAGQVRGPRRLPVRVASTVA